MKKWCIPCVRGVIGDRVYYSALLQAEQIAKRVKSFHEIREAKTLEDWLQRKLHDRTKKIEKYLLTREDRFFSSIIVGVFGGLPKWIPFDMRKAMTDLKIEEEVLADDTIGLLVFSGAEQMFAIDGQHRVEGIRLAFEKDPEAIARDEYSAIFVAHIDDLSGKIETRRLFSDINKRAVPVSKGDKVVIDEDEINAIVARKLYASYRPFEGGKLIANTETEKLAEGDNEHFTNLLTLYTVNQKLRRLWHKPRGTPEYAPENVASFYSVAVGFYDFVFENVPSFRRFFAAKTTKIAAQRRNNRNLLFRPAGLTVLAQLYALFHEKNLLPNLAHGLKNLKFESPGGIFDGILWRNGKVGPRASDRTAAVHLIAYKLGLDLESPDDLRDRISEMLNQADYKLQARLIEPTPQP